mmetsp:Transcript_24897/g.54304  ORF Transcript_24897/g.54304 Transcript_24897/m.54304 type:complete len:83 (+) Transcript_24897:165-413(+)
MRFMDSGEMPPWCRMTEMINANVHSFGTVASFLDVALAVCIVLFVGKLHAVDESWCIGILEYAVEPGCTAVLFWRCTSSNII